jgi:hypothetical protein
MNKNTPAKILTGILLALASSGAMAQQTALQQLGAEAGVDAASMTQQFKNVRAMDAGEEPVVGIPRNGQDVLAGCSALAAKAIMPWNISQAVIMTQTCLNHVYASDGDFQVVAQAARFGKRACPEGPATCKAVMEVVGIKIVVTGQVMLGNSVLLDLDTTLSLRDGKLFGYDAIVENQAQIGR